MLQSLRLSCFAVVDELEVSFGPGLTVLTGETGAGKSILIDALSLLLGGRAESEMVRTGCDEAVVEGVFECTPDLRGRLEELGLPDLGPELTLRRVIGRNGRGKTHVNGAMVGVGVMGRLMRGLIDIAGQHEHLALFDAARHVELLDNSGGEKVAKARAAFAESWAKVLEHQASLSGLGGDEASVVSKREFLKFQLDEIDKLKPRAGEDAELEAEHRRLASTEKLRAWSSQASELLNGLEAGALDACGKALALVGDSAKLDASLAKVFDGLKTAQVELQEAAHALERHQRGLESDPQRLREVDDRLDALKRLCRKHAAPLEGVIAKGEALASELDVLDRRAEIRTRVEAELAAARAEAQRRATELSKARGKAARQLEKEVGARLGALALDKAKLSVRLEPATLTASGADAVELFFSANPGEPERPLAKVASGGEASRVMLALKASLAQGSESKCFVLDEADAGVGGAVADVVGRLIRELAEQRQVLCITHLPQVAAHASAHHKVVKGEQGGRVSTHVESLSQLQQRSAEIARMMSGVTVTKEAHRAARALMRAVQAA
ncbi:MAG: DNA repair protein RecN [Myxococcaceae bacterium]